MDDVPKEESSEKELQVKKLGILSNDKIQFDNAMHQSNIANTNNISFREQLQAEYLADRQQEREHKETLFRQYCENNRKTLSFLYDVEIPEAVANAIIVKAAKLIVDEQ